MQDEKKTRKNNRDKTRQGAPGTIQTEIVRGVYTFIDLLRNPIKIKLVVDELRRMTREADEKKASVWIPIFAREYPDAYRFILSLVDRTPEEAAVGLMERWPGLGIMTAYDDHLNVIRFLQGQIKMRRGERHDKNTQLENR